MQGLGTEAVTAAYSGLFVIVENDTQLQGLRRIGRIVADTLARMQSYACAGMTTAELDALGGALLEHAGATSAPQLCYDFPGFTCISVNEEAAHGIPGERVLQPGDLVNVDVSAMLDGYFADTGGSFVLAGDETATASLKQRLCAAALRARDIGVAHARTGQRLNDIGRHIERSIHAAGFRNVRNLCGHGVGAALHEEPTMRNYYDPRDNEVLQEGQVITIEPFLSTNVSRVRELADGWTLAGRPSSLFAQYEHTLVVTRGEPIITTIDNL
ncbi:MAG: type I methionyl aminopeptidase [Steroidobacteraceae bacterium]